MQVFVHVCACSIDVVLRYSETKIEKEVEILCNKRSP
jgi:hypothetical protein